MVSDRRLLAWFSSYGQQTPSLQPYLSRPLHSLSLPSLDLYSSVITSTSNSTVLDAMKLMSEEGVSSIAVLDEETSALLSAVSVTDIGKVSLQILATWLELKRHRLLFPPRATKSYQRPCTNSSRRLRYTNVLAPLATAESI